MSSGSQVDKVLKKCNSLLFLLSRIKLYLPLSMRKMFFNSYILPHLDYCCIIWGNCSKSLQDRVIRFQKRAARLILDKSIDTPSADLFAELRWMAFPERVKYQKAVLMYKTLHGQAPEYLANSFTFNSDIHQRQLRSSSMPQLYTPRPRTELFRKSFKYSGANIWNSLPIHIRNSDSVTNFKSSYVQWYNQVTFSETSVR